MVLQANWTPGRARAGHYICRTCTSTRQQAYKDKIGLDVHRKRAAKQARERRLRDPEKYRLAKFVDRLKNEYGITLEEHQNLLTAQQGLCAICKVELTPKTQVHTDHDHSTGKVRGILCHRCNVGLGHFRDDTTLLRSAIWYLIDPPHR